MILRLNQTHARLIDVIFQENYGSHPGVHMYQFFSPIFIVEKNGLSSNLKESTLSEELS